MMDPALMFDHVEKRFSPAQLPLDHSRLPPIIYHYTDAAGLVGMLSSNKIWASEYRFLNDRTEVEHTRTIATSVVQSRLLSNRTMTELYTKILEKIGDIAEETEVYIFSLSTLRDSLSQWRGYAQNGRGFTVGLDTRRILQSTESDTATLAFCRIEYDDKNQERGIMLALDEIERICTLQARKKSVDLSKIYDDAATSFDVIMWNRSIANKHSSFSTEDEWRIFCFSEGPDEGERKVRARSGSLIPYNEFSAEELCGENRLPIVEIGIGPGFNDRGQLKAVNALCRQFGYKNVKTYFANAPYRSG